MTALVGIDIGGTFTDIVGFDTGSGELCTVKIPSTPSNPEVAFIKGLGRLVDAMGVSDGELGRISHGTTIATNAIIQRRGSRIGILTTAGFEDVIIIGRQKRTEMYDVMMDPETPTFLADRDRIIGIRERIAADGTVLIELDEAALLKEASALLQRGVEAFAVCFLFSFVNATHERKAAQILENTSPQVPVSLSSSIDPRFREYERFVLTSFDAYVRPLVGKYIERITSELASRGVPLRLHVMQSRGGITGSDLILERPVSTVLSGPAAGAVGSAFVGMSAGEENVISLDIGGTSCDLTLIRSGRPMVTSDGRLEQYPLRQPMVDVHTLGAGGGSTAWVDAGGALHVGPESAGADPGPACYGKGGEQATVTDASLVLGYLDPDYYAGGEMRLSRDLARRAVQEKVASPLGLSLNDAAAGIHRVLNARMADRIRLISVGRGYDPRGFALVCGGGAGGLHAVRLARLVGIGRVVIPQAPGLLSAFGLLVADIEHEESATFIASLDALDISTVLDLYSRLDVACAELMHRDGVARADCSVRHLAELRYRGQSYELEVAFPEPSENVGEVIASRFNDVHRAVYGHAFENEAIELVTLRSIHSYAPPKPSVKSRWRTRDATPEPRTVSAYFEEAQAALETRVVHRSFLANRPLRGPALILQPDTTILVPPGTEAAADRAGNIVFTIG